MKELNTFLRRIDRYCARLNAGLAAVAIVLAVVASAQLTVRANSALITALQSTDVTTAPNVAN